jgi:hypothetical protein
MTSTVKRLILFTVLLSFILFYNASQQWDATGLPAKTVSFIQDHEQDHMNEFPGMYHRIPHRRTKSALTDKY